MRKKSQRHQAQPPYKKRKPTNEMWKGLFVMMSPTAARTHIFFPRCDDDDYVDWNVRVLSYNNFFLPQVLHHHIITRSHLYYYRIQVAASCVHTRRETTSILVNLFQHTTHTHNKQYLHANMFCLHISPVPE